jgi:NAD+ kinase
MVDGGRVRPMGRVAILHSMSSPEGAAAAARLDHDLRAAGITVAEARKPVDLLGVDLLLLLGGDGFLMDSLRSLGYPKTPVYGINFGSVGFLMNPKKAIEGLVRAIRESRFQEEEHPLLEARVRLVSGAEETRLAVNDVVLERSAGQSLRLRVLVNGVLLNELSGDGIIAATSAGSTAYNLAAGGPVFHPRIPAIVVTPLYPHRAAPFNSLQFSVVLPLDSKLELVGLDIQKRPIRLLSDGLPAEGVSEVTVKDSGRRLSLLRSEAHEFVATLGRKFIGPAP